MSFPLTLAHGGPIQRTPLPIVVVAGYISPGEGLNNFTSTFVMITFWVGLVAVSILFGDVFRAFNPWRAIGRAVAFLARLAARGDFPPPLEYPPRLGLRPAAPRPLSFTPLELGHPTPG